MTDKQTLLNRDATYVPARRRPQSLDFHRRSFRLSAKFRNSWRQAARKRTAIRAPYRTISTEQWARAATAEETLPSKHLPSPPNPLAPTKIESAPQFSASLSSNRLGSSSSVATEVANPAACNLSAAASTIPSATPFSPASRSAKCESAFSEGAIGIFQEELTTRASAPRGHWRSATAPTAASAPFDPSTPTIRRTGAPGSTV